MAEPILMSDPRVVQMPVTDCDEPLVDLRSSGAVRTDPRKQDPAGAFARVRDGLCRRLELAADLLPGGIQLMVIEGYRPPALQAHYFAEYLEELRSLHPDWPHAQLHAAASRYVAPPDVAPHTTGGAVDLSLCTADGAELDMGTHVNASPEESRGACYTGAAGISVQARRHRSILAEVLVAVGLVNYPTEWWHWSVGDRYWAVITGRSAAFYGPTEI